MRAVLKAAALAAMLSAPAAVLADDDMGGTSMWKQAGQNRFLIEIDWWYIVNPEDKEATSYVLYDNDTGLATGTLAGSYDNGADGLTYFFVTKNGCKFSEKMSTSSQLQLVIEDPSVCAEENVFAGVYDRVWDHMDPMTFPATNQ